MISEGELPGMDGSARPYWYIHRLVKIYDGKLYYRLSRQ